MNEDDIFPKAGFHSVVGLTPGTQLFSQEVSIFPHVHPVAQLGDNYKESGTQ